MVMAVPGVGILMIFGVLLLFGVAWLFHHHMWKPVVGALLFVVGLAALLMFGWTSARFSASPVAEFAPRSAVPYPPPSYGEESGPSSGHSDTPTYRLETRSDASRPNESTESASGRSRQASSGARAKTDGGESKPPDDNGLVADASPSTPSTGSQSKDADAKPAWVDRSPGLKAAGNGFEATVVSGLYATRAECDRAIIPRVKELADEYVVENFPDAVDNDLSLDRGYIWSKLVKEKYWEKVDKTFGAETHPMNQLHVLLAFDSRVGRDLTEQARQAVVEARLMNAAEITGCSLAVLGGIYLLLKRGATPRVPTPQQIA